MTLETNTETKRLVGTQELLANSQKGALSKYRDLVVGSGTVWDLIKYEVITGLFGELPGMLGLGLRRIFYPFLFKETGRGVVFGKGISIRNPAKIRIGNGVVIADYCELNAAGESEGMIALGEGVFLGRCTILAAKGGTIEIGERSCISSNCRLATYTKIRIGSRVGMGAHTYLIGANHRSERTDIPILDQPLETMGGVEIGDGAWIGTGVVVMDGIKIGHDSIVGAGAVLREDIPALSVATPHQRILMTKRVDNRKNVE